MIGLPKIIHKKLSLRLSLIVVSAMAVLLLSSLGVMVFYARKALKEEALHKASQTLENTVQRIDNILLSVEQTSGNYYFRIWPYLKSKETMLMYSRQIVESNPYIIGCAFAFKPGYYEDGKTFMAYHHRKGPADIVRSDVFGDTPYTEQAWYLEPMKTGMPVWTKPLSNDHYHRLCNRGDEALAVITFCLPLYNLSGETVGVMGVDVSLSQLTRLVLEAKPSKNSYCTLLDAEGSFLVHPNRDKLYDQTVLAQLSAGADPSMESAVKAMMSGETGYKLFRMQGADYYVFYKPFNREIIPGRALGELGWSAGVIYPKADIFGDYESLLYYVLAIAIAGILTLFLLCRSIIHRQLLPLRLLTQSAQRIANGHYDETIPDSHQADEIGCLQDNFQQMQLSLGRHIGQLEQLKATLQERGEGLRQAYDNAKKADRMKTAFLHNMTNQMIAPADAINQSVAALCNPSTSVAEKAALAEEIQKNGNTIAELLESLINLSDEEKRKEAGHD